MPLIRDFLDIYAHYKSDYYYYCYFYLGKNNKSRGSLKIKGNTKTVRRVRPFSECSHRLANYGETVWHCNVARASLEEKSSLPCTLKISLRSAQGCNGHQNQREAASSTAAPNSCMIASLIMLFIYIWA